MMLRLRCQSSQSFKDACHHATPFEWAAAVLEVQLGADQCAKACEVLDEVIDVLTKRLDHCMDLSEAADRCLRYGESVENITSLSGEIFQVCQEADDENVALMAKLKE